MSAFIRALLAEMKRMLIAGSREVAVSCLASVIWMGLMIPLAYGLALLVVAVAAVVGW